jgi:hypothetical protein
MPPRRAMATISSSSARPASPVSLKPEVSTTANLTPRSAHWPTTSSTAEAGTTITATSGVAGRSATLR